MEADNVNTGLVTHDRDLEQILALQQRNLRFSQDGFVTVNHTLEILQAFHTLMPSVVARHQGNVIGYALSMPCETRQLVPVLHPMFDRLGGLALLSGQRWYVMGQICIDRAWRGRGLVGHLYATHRACYADRFDWLVTEIAQRNPRSLTAHQRVGFTEIDHYSDATDEWSVVGLKLNDTR